MVKLIALDEMGQFENRNQGIRFVGGYVGNIESIDEEEQKIENFLKGLCDEFNKKYIYPQKLKYKVFYPRSIHGSGKTFFCEELVNCKSQTKKKWKELPEEQYKKYEKLEKKFNQFLEERVSSYLKENGYQLYVFLDPFTGGGYQEMVGVRANIVSLEHGANLYERMAILTLYNQVFYSLDSVAEQYAFQIATRTLEKNENDWEEMYEVYTNASGVSKSAITNTSTYKTALASMLFEKNREEKYLNAQYQFQVKSINYDNEREKKTPYLYLADIVCSHIRRAFQKAFYIDVKTNKNMVTVDGLLDMEQKTEFQIRIYDESETKFRNMVENVKKLDITEYYGELYELEQSKGMYKEFYLKSWVPKLEQYFKNLLKFDKEYRTTFFSRFLEYYTVTNGYMGMRENDFEKGMYIAKHLCSIIEDAKEYRDRNTMLFGLYDIILRGYNHRGAIKKTKEYIEKCEIYRSHVGIEEYVEHTLRTLGYYFNSMQYENALRSGLGLENAVKQLKKVYEECYDEANGISQEIIKKKNNVDSTHFTLAGKVYSSIGQAYGFLKKNGQAKKYFLKALQEFDNHSADYKITTSHLLQLFLSNKNKAEYETYAVGYFGTVDLWEQLQNAFSENDKGFAFLIYVKAFRTFYAKDPSYDYILEEIIKKTDSMKKEQAHPWELIYKNIYESILEQNKIENNKQYEYIKQKALQCVQNPDATIKMIQIGFRLNTLEDLAKKKKMCLADVLEQEELAVCKNYISDAEEMTVNEFLKKIKGMLTYSYM